MSFYNNSICALGFAAILGACAQQEPAGISWEPIFDKYGEATGCVDDDGRIVELPDTYRDPNRRNPCVPEECEDGYIIGANELFCYPPTDRGRSDEDDDDPRSGPNGRGGDARR